MKRFTHDADLRGMVVLRSLGFQLVPFKLHRFRKQRRFQYLPDLLTSRNSPFSSASLSPFGLPLHLACRAVMSVKGIWGPPYPIMGA
ncbi:hypothetical protein [Aeromonas salmonicida]|uniref:hypothetical protein n=1 Tax=Aeromonas salmonicida TaxID=645 RepID=UPI0019503083|nr:hypothetical protein [Aeromonas salmonicida]